MFNVKVTSEKTDDLTKLEQKQVNEVLKEAQIRLQEYVELRVSHLKVEIRT